jgi:hypothetical protein
LKRYRADTMAVPIPVIQNREAVPYRSLSLYRHMADCGASRRLRPGRSGLPRHRPVLP